MKITSAIITAMPRPMPERMFDPMPEVVATFEDGTTKTVAVRPDVDLSQRKVGDKVVIRATEALALTVEKR